MRLSESPKEKKEKKRQDKRKEGGKGKGSSLLLLSRRLLQLHRPPSSFLSVEHPSPSRSKLKLVGIDSEQIIFSPAGMWLVKS